MARLERVAHEVAIDWGVQLKAPLGLARYSYVAPAGERYVLKVTPVEDDEADHEGDALAYWNGDGAVRLVRRDRKRRALLLERARPGIDASRLPETEATAIAMQVGRRLWRRVEPGDPFRQIVDRVPGWLDAAGDHDLVRVAKDVYAAMRVESSTLLHGDFHHHNLLQDGARWVAIDPKPIAGEPEFDVATFLWNPIGSVSSRERTERRIAAFVAAGLDLVKIRSWAIVRGVYLGLPLSEGETEETSPQIRVVKELL